MKVIVLAYMLCLAILTGCAGLDDTSLSLTPGSADEAIIMEVERRLDRDPVTARLQLGVESNDGIVTLSGRIDSPAAKLRAVSAVRGTAGVKAVIDNTVRF